MLLKGVVLQKLKYVLGSNRTWTTKLWVNYGKIMGKIFRVCEKVLPIGLTVAHWSHPLYIRYVT